jgi:hypothetical protein
MITVNEEQMQEYFPAAYPKMFSGQYGGIAVGKGWFNILNLLCQNVQSHIDWKNSQRQREIDKFNAREQGLEALIKFYQGRANEPSEWDIKSAQETMENGVKIYDEIPQVVVTQVKEKFGSLRFYYDGGDDVIDGMVRIAESLSGVTCEDCGDVGETRQGGWIRVQCDHHYEQSKKKRGQ